MRGEFLPEEEMELVNSEEGSSVPTPEAPETQQVLLPKGRAIIRASDIEVSPSVSRSREGSSMSELPFNPHDTAGLFSRLSFAYVTPFVAYGASNTIKKKDLLPLPTRSKPQQVTERFTEAWKAECRLPKGQRSLMRSLFAANRQEFLVSGVVKVVYDFSLYISPVLLKMIVNHMKDQPDLHKASGVGLGIVVLLFFVQFTSLVCLHQYFGTSFVLGINFKTTLVQAILDKCLTLPGGGVGSASQSLSTNHGPSLGGGTGSLISLSSVDVNRVQEVMALFHTVWSGPLQLCIGCGLLLNLLGWSFCAGIAVMFISVPLALKISKRGQRLNKVVMTQKDKRIKLTTEVLSGIKIIKMYAWELPFTDKIEAARAAELAEAFRYKMNIALNRSVYSAVPVLVAVLSFACYILLSGQPLEVGQALASLLVFNQLRFPLNMMPSLLVSLMEARLSLQRIQSLLERNEVPIRPLLSAPPAVPGAFTATEKSKLDAGKTGEVRAPLVALRDASFDWPTGDNCPDPLPEVTAAEENAIQTIQQRDAFRLERYSRLLANEGGPTLLRDLNLLCYRGQLTVIAGSTGAGKSGLVQSIIGECMRVKGTLEVRGELAYCSQLPWIQNMTVQNNILFGKPMNRAWYERVLKVCCLDSDLALLGAGDQTEIGEKGINLSGGQKARVALARAVYARPDVIVLDDVLAAVDAHVSARIMQTCVEEVLLAELDCSVIVVSHAPAVLQKAHQIVLLKDHKAAFQGSFPSFASTPEGSLFLQQSHEEEEDEAIEDVLDGADDVEGDTSTSAPQPTKRLSSSSARKSQQLPPAKTVPIPSGPSVPPSAMMGQLIGEEKNEEGSISKDVYMRYAKEIGGWASVFGIILAGVASQSAVVLSSTSLTQWTKVDNPTQDTQLRGLAIYGVFGLGNICATATIYYLSAVCAQRGARNFHLQLLTSVLNAPMRFFDTTPVGRLVNRFSKDINAIDDSILSNMQMVLMQVLSVGSTLIVMIIVIPVSFIPLCLLYFVYRHAQRLYVPASRQLRRLESSLRSPYISLLTEVVSGSSVIRAFPSAADRFIHENRERVEMSQRAYFQSLGVNRWIAYRLELLGSIATCLAALICVVPQVTGHSAHTSPEHPGQVGHWVEAAMVGLVLSYTMSINQALSWLVRMIADVESNVVAIERVLEYCNCPKELSTAPAALPVDQNWPPKGEVTFADVSMRYAPHLPRVIKKLSFNVKAGERIGLVGRTGAGKSSMLLALLRLVELDDNRLPDEVELVSSNVETQETCIKYLDDFSYTSATVPTVTAPSLADFVGQVKIDGVPLAAVPLRHLRSRLSVIPQDPVLFTGTLRFNLDPAGEYTDEQLMWAVEEVHLSARLAQEELGLDMEVQEGGSNMSVGERQLLCIARALLRHSKVLLLDEATSAIDLQTDALIQATIRRVFGQQSGRGCTLLTIAHRIHTIMDYDRIIVLDAGKVLEFDSPSNLLSAKNGVFRSLAEQAGLPVPQL